MLSEGYGIMPNRILFDEELKDKEKLLYCYISSLCAEKGHCYASNKHIANKLNTRRKGGEKRAGKTTPQTISKYISSLEQKGYITTELIYKENSKEIKNRLVYLVNTPINKLDNTSGLIKQYPINKLVKDNNTSNNIISNNNNINITEQSSVIAIIEEIKEDKRDIEIDEIIEALKNCNLGILDDPVIKQRQYGKLLKNKILKIQGFNYNQPGDFAKFILYLYENSNEFKKNHFRSAEKFYRELGGIIGSIKIDIEKRKQKSTGC